MTLNTALLQSSLDLVVARQPQLTARFYEILFARYPQVRPLFGRNAPAQQQKMLQDAIVAVVFNVEDGAWLTHTLRPLGAKHSQYGVTPEMYAWVGECLIATLKEAAGEAWTSELESTWVAAYGAVSGLMLDGARTATVPPVAARGEQPRV